MWAVAIITMSVGAIVGVTQTDVKRLLAYSSIAHAGFILTAVAALAPASARDSESGVMFYLVAYGFMTIGSFAIVMLVRDGDGEANHLSRWVGSWPQIAPGCRHLRVLPVGARRAAWH